MNQPNHLQRVGGTSVPKKGADASRVKVKESAGAKALPEILVQLRNHALEDLHRMIGAMFYQADDLFFDYARRAGSPEAQEACLNAMRDLRLKKKEVEKSFYTHIAKAFHRLPDPRFYKPVSLKPVDLESQLALMQNDELEENVAFDGMVKKAREQFASQLYQINTRLDVVLLSVGVNQSNSPLDPVVLCEAFSAATRLVKCDIKYRLIFFKMFQRHILDIYDEVLDNCNFRLAKAGVLPDLKDTPRQLRKTTGIQQKAASDKANESSKSNDSTADAAYAFFAELQSLMASVRQCADTISTLNVIGSNSANAQPIDNAELMQILNGLQKIQPRGMPAEGAESGNRVNARDALSNFLRQQESRVGPRKVDTADADVINLVALLFDFILDDDNLPDRVKAVIGRLQIPYVKVALIDRTFFSRPGHPARKLINAFARAGLGLAGDNVELLQQDAVFKQIQSSVQQVLDQFSQDVNCFDAILEEFTTVTQVELRRAGMIEQRTRAAEEGKARSEEARQVAAKALEEKVGAHELPSVVLTLLNDVWFNYLCLIYLKQGTGSSQWQTALGVVDRLLASVTPARDPQHLKQLFADFPALSRDLRAGFDAMSFNTFKASELMSELESTQVQVLQGKTPDYLAAEPVLADPVQPAEEAATSARVEPQPGGAPIVDIQQAVSARTAKVTALNVGKPETSEAKPVVASLPDSDEALVSAKALQVGSWLEYTDAEGAKHRRKLAAFIRSVDKLIFVNRKGIKVCEQNVLETAHDFKSRRLVLLNDSLLFDRALENVIGNLRKIREQNG